MVKRLFAGTVGIYFVLFFKINANSPGKLHCFLGCKEPLYQENLKLGQSDKRGKYESGNKKYAKNDYFLIRWVILMGHLRSF